MAVYYASKAFVLSFSEALHKEMSGRGVRVTALCPGPVLTEFQARSGVVLPGIAKLFELPAARVAEIGYDALKRGQRVAIAGLGNKIAVALMHFVPNALLMRVVDERTRD
jgi:short-subunit dehydrogenase